MPGMVAAESLRHNIRICKNLSLNLEANYCIKFANFGWGCGAELRDSVKFLLGNFEGKEHSHWFILHRYLVQGMTKYMEVWGHLR